MQTELQFEDFSERQQKMLLEMRTFMMTHKIDDVHIYGENAEIYLTGFNGRVFSVNMETKQ